MYRCGTDCSRSCSCKYASATGRTDNWALGREFDTKSFLAGILRVVLKYEPEGSKKYKKFTKVLRDNAMSLQCLHGAAGNITNFAFTCNMDFEILQYLSEKLIVPMADDRHACEDAECLEFLHHAIRNNRFDYLCGCYNHIAPLIRRDVPKYHIDHLYHTALYALELSGHDLALQWLKEFSIPPSSLIIRMIRDENIIESSRLNWFAKMLRVYPRYDLVEEDELNQEARYERDQRFGRYLEAIVLKK